LSPQEGKFNSSNVKLNFAVDQMATIVEYSLDDQENVTVTGNTTLTGLPNGYHNVTIFATDEAGHTGASETLSFEVEVPNPVPIAPLAAAIAVIAVAAGAGAAGLLLYKGKREKRLREIEETI
jgi:hypothetical protein